MNNNNLELISSGMETRSKSQSSTGKNEDSMADIEVHSTGKQHATSRLREGDNSHSDSDKEMHLKQHHAESKIISADATSENATLKGLVASRIEQINNTPPNSPSTGVRNKTKQNKKRNKLRMVGAKNGKLSVEEEESDTNEPGMDNQRNHAESSQRKNQESGKQLNPNSVMDILHELNSTVKRLEDKIDNMDKERRSQNKKVRNMELAISQDSAALTAITDSVDNHDEKIKALTGIVTRQQQQIEDLTYKLNNLFVNQNSKKLTIAGLAETQGENCFHEVSNFFKNIMKIDTQIPLKMAKRTGVGEARLMLIKLKYHEHKSLIFQNLGQLKIANKKRPKPYYISDQLPEVWAERRRFTQHIKFQNSRLPAEAQHNVEVKRGVLEVNGTPYEPLLQTPSISDIMNMTNAERASLQELDITAGDTENLNKSRFIGYAADAFSFDQVKKQQLAIRLKHPTATHISAAFRVPGDDFTTNQGLVDDGEHGGARAIMKVLFKEKRENTAVFVVRYYGGKHLGPARFGSIEKAAKSAIDKVQEATLRARRPLSQEELAQLNQEIQLAAEQQENQERQQQRRFNWDSQADSTEDSDDQSVDTDFQAAGSN